MSNTTNANASGSKQATNQEPRMSEKELKKQAKAEFKAKSQNTGETAIEEKDTKSKIKDKTLEVAKDKVKKEEKAKAEKKYKYPEDCNTPALEKTFRRKARATRSSFEEKIEALIGLEDKESKSKLKALRTEFDTFMEETYNIEAV